MRHHHSPGIRGQLMWFLCCICLFLLALVWFLSTQLLEPLYTKHIEKQLTTQAESITADLDKALAEDETLSSWSFGRLSVNTSFFDRLATQLYASGSLNSFCVDISDSTMRTIYKIENQSYCNLHETLLSDSANNDMIVSTAVAMRKKCRTTGGFVQTLNPPRLSGSAQLLVGRNTAGGEYTVLVTTSLVHVAEAGKILSTVLPMAAAVIFAFAMTAGWLFSEWFTKPLRQLSSAARQMAMGNYAVQVDTRRSDELGDLAQDFNHMANEVQRSSQMQRDLLANVSHDLRTPLTLIKGYAETVRDITGDDKAHRDEQMNIIVDETDRLTALVSSVMELSKVTSGAAKCERVHFDMAQLCDEVSERYDAICAQNGWQLKLELPDEELPVYADPDMMQRALPGKVIGCPLAARCVVEDSAAVADGQDALGTGPAQPLSRAASAAHQQGVALRQGDDIEIRDHLAAVHRHRRHCQPPPIRRKGQPQRGAVGDGEAPAQQLLH